MYFLLRKWHNWCMIDLSQSTKCWELWTHWTWTQMIHVIDDFPNQEIQFKPLQLQHPVQLPVRTDSHFFQRAGHQSEHTVCQLDLAWLASVHMMQFFTFVHALVHNRGWIQISSFTYWCYHWYLHNICFILKNPNINLTISLGMKRILNAIPL